MDHSDWGGSFGSCIKTQKTKDTNSESCEPGFGLSVHDSNYCLHLKPKSEENSLFLCPLTRRGGFW